jgi:ectoine hydroxylase-related dioxygenase (phytanoyl-CoA dioxygenase family)
MRNVLNNNAFEQEFQKNGYISLPFLNTQEVSELKEIFFNTLPESGGQITSGEVKMDEEHLITYDFTFIDKNIDYKRKVFDEITKYFEPHMKKVLANYKPIIANFIRKHPGAGEVPMHQNWAFADERKCSTVSIWCPLVDSTAENGTLQVVPGSHKRFGEARGPMVPSELEGIKNEIISKHLIPLETSAGDCVVLDDSIVHYSPINNTEGLRLAVQLICIPKELPSYHYFLDPTSDKNKIQVLEVDQEFYTQFNPWKLPTNMKVVAEIPFQFKPLSEEDFVQKLKEPRFDEEDTSSSSKKTIMKRLFKDETKQRFFDKNGFVKFPMLGVEEVESLKTFFYDEDLRVHTGYGFNMSMENEDKEKVARIRQKIYEIALPKAMEHFHNAKVIAGSYVVKEKNPQGVVPPHQDWTFVNNEGENYSVTCWIPLVPTKMENGYMGVIKGSHLIYDNIRPSPSPQVPTPLMEHLFAIFPYLEMYEMQPGEALIFDHRTFHASTPNITDDPRIAIGLGFTQEEAEICHYSLKQNGLKDTLLKYKVDDAFLLKYDNAKISKMYDAGLGIEGYEVIDELPYVYPKPSSDELLKLIKGAGNEFNIELCEHMAKLFNYSMDGSKKIETEVVSETDTATLETPNTEPAPSFWEVYTPLNIAREIKLRLIGK